MCVAAWYFNPMKNHQSETRRMSDPITNMAASVAEVMAERSRVNKELLQALALAVAENERIQRRFRTAALIRLSNIETIVQMIHSAQIVEAHQSEPCLQDKAKEHVKAAQEYISQHSKELGLKMVSYVYDDSETQSPQPEIRRKRRQSPSYEI